MADRKTIRPVTLRRVVEVCSLASQSKFLNIKNVSKKLNTTPSRAKEVLLEVERMDLLSHVGDFWIANSRTSEFLRYFESKDWEKIHKYFLKHYNFYSEFIRILQDYSEKEEGLSVNEIIEEAVRRKTHLNRTAAEVLSDWCERLGIVQRNLYTAKIYFLRDEKPSLDDFFSILLKIYRKLSISSWRREVFVEIPLIREHMCEQLKISRKTFDKTLKQVYLNNIGKIELSGAPITTLAKKSPLSEKRIKLVGKKAIMSTQSRLQREREGITINKKTYYYLAMHKRKSTPR